MIPLLLASITAVLTSYFFLGDDVLLHFNLEDKFILSDVTFYVFLGVASSLASIYFSKVYFTVGAFFKKIKKPYYKLLIGGSLLGIIVYFIPPLFGEGFTTINSILKGNVQTTKYQSLNVNLLLTQRVDLKCQAPRDLSLN